MGPSNKQSSHPHPGGVGREPRGQQCAGCWAQMNRACGLMMRHLSPAAFLLVQPLPISRPLALGQGRGGGDRAKFCPSWHFLAGLAGKDSRELAQSWVEVEGPARRLSSARSLPAVTGI